LGGFGEWWTLEIKYCLNRIAVKPIQAAFASMPAMSRIKFVSENSSRANAGSALILRREIQADLAKQ